MIRFFYDCFENSGPTRYVSDFESHVFLASALQLLFLHAGFAMEGVWADFTFRAPRSWSREIVLAGRRDG